VSGGDVVVMWSGRTVVSDTTNGASSVRSRKSGNIVLEWRIPESRCGETEETKKFGAET